MVSVIQRPQPILRADGKVTERDLRPAMEYGPLRYIFEAEERVAFHQKPALDRLREVLSAFDPDQDYILWAGLGDPAAAYLVLLTLGGLRRGRVRFLYWSRELDPETGLRTRSGHYWVFSVDLTMHWRQLLDSSIADGGQRGPRGGSLQGSEPATGWPQVLMNPVGVEGPRRRIT